MADQASVKFARAYSAMRKAADAHPEYFDLARDVLRRHDDGSLTLLHALMQGLQECYEAGRAGKPPPPLRLVQSSAELRAANPNLEGVLKRVAPQHAVPDLSKITSSTHGFAATKEATPQPTPKRVVRRAR